MSTTEKEIPELKSKSETERCTGKCCKDFGFSMSPMERDFIVRLAQRNKSLPFKKLSHTELFQIADMLIFKRSDKHPYHNENKSQTAERAKGSAGRWSTIYHYTCRHLKGSDCSIYPWRPLMCSNFPYGNENEDGSCKYYKGCTRRKEFIP